MLVNSSITSVSGADAGRLPVAHLYYVTKAALNSLVFMMAWYEKFNIRTYGICPAVFGTKMVDDLVSAESTKGFGFTNPHDVAAICNPRYKKAGDPAHIGELVLSLFNGATKYKSGECIVIDHDVTWNIHEFYCRMCLPYNPAEPDNARNLLGDLLQKNSSSS